MNLPPSIEAIIENHDSSSTTYDLVVKIAHEACRLQREYDKRFLAERWQRYGDFDAPLVLKYSTA